MPKELALVSIFGGITVFIVFLLISVLFDESARKKSVSGRNDWLFGHFNDKVFGAFFGRTDPYLICEKLGIKSDRYLQSCRITKDEPDPKGLVMDHLYGIAILTVSAVLSMTVNYYIIVVGVAGFAFFFFRRQRMLDAKAERMRAAMATELPRFTDLLLAELEVGLPIENAIYVLCSRMENSLLADEFIHALGDMKLGSKRWTDALLEMAERYDLDTLNDFVLNVTTSYKQGTSIVETVRQKSKDVKESHLLNIKEQAGKATNTILIPIVIFQFLPMMVYLMVPVLSQVQTGLIW